MCCLLSTAEFGSAVVSEYRANGIRGIRKGSSLSPLLGELYLSELDRAFKGRENTYYQRYVEDIIVLANSRRELRNSIREIKQILRRHKLQTRYAKTYIGKASEPIIYLGFRLLTFPLPSLCFKSALCQGEAK